MKKMLIAICHAALLVVGCAASAKGPVQNISAKKHPNLHAAQKFLEQADQKITAAQKANEYDMEGHAAKAKELIEQASSELKLAAEAANRNK